MYLDQLYEFHVATQVAWRKIRHPTSVWYWVPKCHTIYIIGSEVDREDFLAHLFIAGSPLQGKKCIAIEREAVGRIDLKNKPSFLLLVVPVHLKYSHLLLPH